MSARRREGGLDTRAWLLWGGAASVPLLTGRHPLVLAELLIVVLAVRAVCLPTERVHGWGWLLRVGMIAVPIGVVFNMFTVHAGDAQFFRVPESVPLVGGTVTWNAAVYGLLSGVTIVVLIAVGTTVAAGMDWSALMRMMPARAAGIVVAGSVAWAFLPQLATSWREIREAQAARGHRWRGARDIVPLVVPLMAGGLDRSITMAEALEARGIGAAAVRQRSNRGASLAMGMALSAGVLALYLFAVGQTLHAAAVAIVAAVAGTFAMRAGRGVAHVRTSRYRDAAWSRDETIVTAGAVLAVLVTAVALQVSPEALRYDPYPTMRWPSTEPRLLVALALLLLPAVVAPVEPRPREGAR